MVVSWVVVKLGGGSNKENRNQFGLLVHTLIDFFLCVKTKISLDTLNFAH